MRLRYLVADLRVWWLDLMRCDAMRQLLGVRRCRL